MAEEGEDFTSLWPDMEHPEKRLNDRKKRELGALSSGKRRTLKATETKTAQLGVRVRPSIKARATQLALAEGISVADLIEKLVEQYEVKQ